MVVLDGVARVRIAVGAAEVEVLVEEGEHVLGEVPTPLSSEIVIGGRHGLHAAPAAAHVR